MITHPIMETEEYKELFSKLKAENPNEYEYFLQINCIANLKEMANIKSGFSIEVLHEIQEEPITE